jgi:YjbE family integral membrane protein
MSWELIVGIATIIYVNLILSGDNAVVIALAVRSLPPQQQRRGIVWGSVGAVALRIALTYVAARLLAVPGLRLGGGLALIWVAYKLVRPSAAESEGPATSSSTLWEAVKIILSADLIMSMDNVLAIAGAAKGSVSLLLFGLGLSIPIIWCGSALMATLMTRYAWLVIAGSALLGKVAGELIVTDPVVSERLGTLAQAAEYGVAYGLAVAIPVVVRWPALRKRLGLRPD